MTTSNCRQAHLRQTGIEVGTERLQLRRGHESVLDYRFTEAAQQGAPLVVRAEEMIVSPVQWVCVEAPDAARFGTSNVIVRRSTG